MTYEEHVAAGMTRIERAMERARRAASGPSCRGTDEERERCQDGANPCVRERSCFD